MRQVPLREIFAMRTLLAAALFLSFLGTASSAPKKLLLVGCPPDGHPPQTHEYMAGLNILKKCLSSAKDLDITVVEALGAWKDGPELMARSDAVGLFLSEGARWLAEDPKRLAALKQVADRKGGLAVIHWGMGTKDAKYIEPFLALFGGCHGGPDRKYVVVETTLTVASPKHPVASGLPGSIKIKDEFYYRLKAVKGPEGIQPLITAKIEDKDETVAWVWERPAGGRSFGFSGLHFHDNWAREEYRRMVAQGVLWTLDVPIPERGVDVPVKEEDLKVKGSN